MSVALLDVNVLVALAWPSHVHHHAAHRWFVANRAKGWATCPLTQCGFVRVSSNPAIIPEAVEPAEALALLPGIVALEDHVFWPDSISLQDGMFPAEMLAGHRQVTDAYLLGLAIHHNGAFVTLDHGVSSLLPTGSPHRDALTIVPLDIA